MKHRHARRDFRDLTGMRAALYCRVSKVEAGDERSVEQQETEGREWAARERVDLVAVFRDADRSASRFATKEREGFVKLLGLIEAGELDVVWVWALNRKQRELAVFAEMRDLFQRKRVALSVAGKLHDPADYSDWMMLGFQALMDEKYSQDLSDAVLRGKRDSAAAGRPAGYTPYGYRRVRTQQQPSGDLAWFDKKSNLWVRQVPDVGNGVAAEDAPAAVVRELVTGVAAGHSLTSMAKDLNRRGVPTPGGGPWRGTKIRRLVMNPTYIAKRVHQGTIVDDVKALWPPLVTEDAFWAAYRILTDPARPTYRHSRAQTLLSFIAKCGACEGALRKVPIGAGRYQCWNACIGVPVDDLDTYVSKTVVRILSDPGLFDAVSARDDSAEVVQARADKDRAEVELRELRRDSDAGLISLRIATGREEVLLGVVADAEQVIKDAHVPPVLRGNIGPHVREKWPSFPLEVQRALVREVLDVRVYPIGSNRRVPITDRVWLRPLIGGSGDDDAGERFASLGQRWEAERADLSRKARELRASGMKWSDVGPALGVSWRVTRNLVDDDPLGGVSVRPKTYRPQKGEARRRERRQRALELRRKDPKEWTYRKIGAELGVSEYAAHNDVRKALEEEGDAR